MGIGGAAASACGEIQTLIEKLERLGKSPGEVLEAVKKRLGEIIKADLSGWY